MKARTNIAFKPGRASWAALSALLTLQLPATAFGSWPPNGSLYYTTSPVESCFRYMDLQQGTQVWIGVDVGFHNQHQTQSYVSLCSFTSIVGSLSTGNIAFLTIRLRGNLASEPSTARVCFSKDLTLTQGWSCGATFQTFGSSSQDVIPFLPLPPYGTWDSLYGIAFARVELARFSGGGGGMLKSVQVYRTP